MSNLLNITIACSLLLAAAHAVTPFERGANTLFIGHSFFVPVSRYFDAIITSSGDFDNHDFDEFFSGGETGSPESLWEDEGKRAAIDNKLSSGDVDLFGMTVYEGPDIAYYRLWIDLALSYNADTTIYIGAPWAKLGPKTATDDFDRIINSISTQVLSMVTDLREEYPNNDIFMISYGKVVSTMMSMLDANMLPDMDQLLGPDESSIFRDENPGHAGAMAEEVSALLWIQILYDTPYQNLSYTTPYDEEDVMEILDVASEFNSGFNTIVRRNNTDDQDDDSDDKEEPGFLSLLWKAIRRLMRRIFGRGN